MKYENVYTVEEENSHRFYQLPKELFINESYKGLSISAKMIYSFLLDRKELSRTNNWIDEYGQVFLLFTRKHVGEMLNLSDKPVTNAFKELIKADLIRKRFAIPRTRSQSEASNRTDSASLLDNGTTPLLASERARSVH